MFEQEITRDREAWEAAPAALREEVENYRYLHQERTSARMEWTGPDALARTSRVKATSGSGGPESGVDGLMTSGGLVKGDVVEADPELTALPDPGSQPRPVVEMSARVASQVNGDRSFLLEEDTEELREWVRRTAEFMDQSPEAAVVAQVLCPIGIRMQGHVDGAVRGQGRRDCRFAQTVMQQSSWVAAGRRARTRPGVPGRGRGKGGCASA